MCKIVNRKVISLMVLWGLVLGVFLCIPVMSAHADTVAEDSGIATMQMNGIISPTVISVTMPTNISFEIEKNSSATNQVISPDIQITNNSTSPVNLIVTNNDVDMSQLTNIWWGIGTQPYSNTMSVGFTETTYTPSDFSGAVFLSRGVQNTKLTTIAAKATTHLFVVGRAGMQVPDSATFIVKPTIMVSKVS